MRILALIFCVVFALSAAVQYNDPDPLIWIAIYGFAAVLSFLYYKGTRNLLLYGLPMVLYFAGAIYLWPREYKGIWMDMSRSIEIELARESLGLAICGFSLMLYLVFSFRQPSGKLK